jgi:hypothetical protein
MTRPSGSEWGEYLEANIEVLVYVVSRAEIDDHSRALLSGLVRLMNELAAQTAAKAVV